MQFVAPVTFSWTPSPNIQGQIVELTLNNVVQPPVSVSATQTSFVVPQVKTGDVLHLSVVEVGQFENSDPSTCDFGPVPDLTPPAPVGTITAVLGSVVQIPDETTTTTVAP